MKLRFLVDTNTLISAALFPGGKVYKVLSYLLETHDLVLCSFSLDEAHDVFKRKFAENLEFLERFLDSIEFTRFDTPTQIDSASFPRIRDCKDLPILVSAILSAVDILITGDKDFTDVEIERPLVFTPAEYLDLVERQ